MRIETKIVINSAFRILNKHNGCVPVKAGFGAVLIHICLAVSSTASSSRAAPGAGWEISPLCTALPPRWCRVGAGTTSAGSKGQVLSRRLGAAALSGSWEERRLPLEPISGFGSCRERSRCWDGSVVQIQAWCVGTVERVTSQSTLWHWHGSSQSPQHSKWELSPSLGSQRAGVPAGSLFPAQ